MRRIVHTWRLLSEFGSYAVINRAYWVLPLIMFLLLVAAFSGAIQTVVPFTLYTLF